LLGSRAFTFINNTSNIKLLESESAGLNLGGPRTTTIKTAVRENVSNKTAKDCVVVLGF
jgi:hypothetical protein